MPQHPAVIKLAQLNGSDGFQINGEVASDYSGWSVASAGDLNGDGFADLIIGSIWSDPNGTNSGAAFVVFGKAAGFGATLELSSLDGSNGFQINGELVGDRLGESVASAGDVNGDGYDDLIIGALNADPNGNYSGASYVVFGKATGFTSVLELSTLDGTNGFQLSGETNYDNSGRHVSSAGDVNGDGFADLLIASSGSDANGALAGAVHVLFGKAGGFAPVINLAALNGADGFQINGEAVGDTLGSSVSAAGDVNGDGFGDIIVGARSADPIGTSSGAAYVLFGKAGGFSANISVFGLTGAAGFQISGGTAYDGAGISVSGTGDVNGDGFDDLIVGAYANDSSSAGAGATYVIFGKAAPFATDVNLSTLSGSSGFQIRGEGSGDQSGWSVASAGDFNGDGFGDVLIGARFADPNGYSTGASYVVFGTAGGFATVDLSALNGDTGFRIDGEASSDRSGFDVAGAGDLNGDGFDDLIVSAPYADPNGNSSGSSWVIFGGPPAVAVERTGTALANRIHGGADDDRLSGLTGADTLIAGAGDDTALGGGGADSLLGGADDDELSGGGGNDILLGEAGDDELQGGGGADLIDGGGGDDRLYGGSSADRLTGGLGNDLLDGGSGLDRADYTAANAAVRVDLTVFGWQNTGGGGFDALWNVEGVLGSRFGDALIGGVFDDSLSGGLGADALAGGEGADTLVGGSGGDRLTGGEGGDRFVFVAVVDSQGTGGNADRITDLTAGDVIDLSAIDADTTAIGDQAFVLQPNFSGIPRQLVLTYQAATDRTLLRGDVNGDGVADFTAILEGGDYTGFTGFVL